MLGAFHTQEWGLGQVMIRVCGWELDLGSGPHQERLCLGE